MDITSETRAKHHYGRTREYKILCQGREKVLIFHRQGTASGDKHSISVARRGCCTWGCGFVMGTAGLDDLRVLSNLNDSRGFMLLRHHPPKAEVSCQFQVQVYKPQNL